MKILLCFFLMLKGGVDRKSISAFSSCSWYPPHVFDLSFNVNGLFRGSPGLAGVGGVLREVGGKVLCLFFSFVGTAEPITAEVLAIYKACSLISSSRMLDDRMITIWSDFSLVVSWINGDGFGKLSLVHLVYDIRQFISSRNLISIKYTPRGSNSLADSLAKAGTDL